MTFADFQRGLYDYYVRHTQNPITRAQFDDEIKRYKERNDKYIVYFGYSRKDNKHKQVIYIGTTIQFPISRFYYHSMHGKNLDFVEKYRFDNEQDMLNKEYEMIQKYRPCMNRITSRKQNLNVTLSSEILEARKGDPQWCQCCLRRHVNIGYKYCYYCTKK